MEKLATPAEVAEVLGVKPDTLRIWSYKGKGPVCVMVGDRRMYDWADVRAWVETRKVAH
jgi:predicted site-specific integrase-resolvase